MRVPPKIKRVVAILATVAVATTAFGGVTAVRAEGGQIPGAIVINGRGYGHGRGMSQYGSYGWATTAGWSWQQILDFYYGGATGNVLAALPDPGDRKSVV